ncbi:MAG: DNA-directed RNA polymerase subunit delta [Spirochaetia bacterium]|nr:DNA-directed RNA polymerase subunit delta [Spirochaetia bacterium]
MKRFLVMQSDFGLADGAVSAMYGVALQVCDSLQIFDLTHEIPPYNIFEASYRLVQTVEYWPKGSVFVSVVDPGVGSKRKSVVALTKDGHYIVTPDNGTLTHVNKDIGIQAIREIEETKHRRKNTEASYTFHGRDVYAHTGAKLASKQITFEDVGELLSVKDIIMLPTSETLLAHDSVCGTIDVLDVRFGSLWTSIDRQSFLKLNVAFGERIEVSIYNNATLVYQNSIIYGRSFADVMIGGAIVYVNSLYRMGIAINQGSFAKAYNIGVGQQWKVTLRRLQKQ